MVDREKVIKGLESLRNICNAKSDMAIGKGKVAWAGYANTADDALSLLKAQEPVEPIRTEVEWLCGNCGESVGWDELQVYGIAEIKNVYCSNCGRKVKWNG